jgi:2-polyprenyl-3-methyl-5-hydroxy-6-metoxy-1,4-benzoquinol methylase
VVSASKYAVQVDLTAPAAHGFAVEMIGSGRKVLELGCAAGHITTILAARGNTVVGVEIDPQAAQAARAFAREVHSFDLDTVDLGVVLGGEQFDVVLAGDVLEHLKDPWRTLGQMAGLLAPGGFCVVSLPNVAHIDLRFALLNGEWRYRPKGLLDDTHLRFFTRDGVTALAEQAGLCVTELRRVMRDPFTTEVAPAHTRFLGEIVAWLLPDDDALTYVYVARLEHRDERTLAVAGALAESLQTRAAAQAAERARVTERRLDDAEVGRLVQGGRAAALARRVRRSLRSRRGSTGNRP